MSDIIYLTLRGAQQGLISSGCGSADSVGNHYQQSHPDEIFVFSLKQSLTRNPQQLVPQGVTFCKPVDKSSPLLMQAINNNERLTLNFSFYRMSPAGRWEAYYAINLRGASIQQIQCHAVVDNIHQEYITVNYDYIHCSANWNAIEINKQGDIQGGAAPAEIVSFVNRPDEGWIRTVYNMDGKKT